MAKKVEFRYNDSAVMRCEMPSESEVFEVEEGEIISKMLEVMQEIDMVDKDEVKDIDHVTPQEAAKIFGFKLNKKLKGLDLILDTVTELANTIDPTGFRNVYKCIYDGKVVFDFSKDFNFDDCSPENTQYVAMRQTFDSVVPIAVTFFELNNEFEGYQDALVRSIKWAAEALGMEVDEDEIPEWDSDEIREYVEQFQLLDIIAVEAQESILDVVSVE